jgi:hypothetical protein
MPKIDPLLAPARSSATPRRMTKPLPLLAGLLGTVFLVLAAVYLLIPAGSLPAFLPGFHAGYAHVHFKHALGSLIVALALFAFAWFQRAPRKS